MFGQQDNLSKKDNFCGLIKNSLVIEKVFNLLCGLVNKSTFIILGQLGIYNGAKRRKHAKNDFICS